MRVMAQDFGQLVAAAGARAGRRRLAASDDQGQSDVSRSSRSRAAVGRTRRAFSARPCSVWPTSSRTRAAARTLARARCDCSRRSTVKRELLDGVKTVTFATWMQPPVARPVAVPQSPVAGARTGEDLRSRPDRRRSDSRARGLGQDHAHLRGARREARRAIRRERSAASRCSSRSCSSRSAPCSRRASPSRARCPRAAAPRPRDGPEPAGGRRRRSARRLRAARRLERRQDSRSSRPRPGASRSGRSKSCRASTLEAYVEDLSGRFNLNSLVDDDGTRSTSTPLARSGAPVESAGDRAEVGRA